MTREEAIVWCDRFNNAWASADPEDDFPDLKYSDTLDQLFYLAGQALRQQGVTDKDVGHNEPLTLAELRQMDREPVWLVNQNGGRWVIMSGVYLWDKRKNAEYGKTWIAYRQKPEEGSV